MTEPFDERCAEIERYELREAPAYHFDTNRREFIHVLGAGLVIAATVDTSQAQRPGSRGGRPQSRRAEILSERFHISDQGVVTVLSSKVEVGQGARTQIAQAAAEELRLEPEALEVVLADTALCPDDGGTAGSRTTPSTVPRVREAAAAARELLIELAAARMEVEPKSVTFEQGVFSSGDQQTTLAALAGDEALQERFAQPVGGQAQIARVSQWRVLGRSIPKINGRDVVIGAVKYPTDVRLEGMLYGAVLRAPAMGARLQSVDLAPAQAMTDVVAVHDGEFVGCAAESTWQARQAIEALVATAEWETTPQVPDHELFAHFQRSAEGSGARARAQSWGQGESALDEANKKWDAAYTVAYIQHAPMEPRAAVSQWQNGGLTVWTGTQQPSRVQAELSRAFRISGEQVRVIVPDTGGGFGGKHSGEVAVEAARLAKAAERPVSLCWTREEEFRWAYFRPAGLIEVAAGLDASGRIQAWDFANYNSGASAINTPYETTNGRTRFFTVDSPLRQGSYRALASTANTFARECAMDELAERAGVDALEFRLQHLPAGRLRDVLVAAAEKFGWEQRVKKGEPNRGVGLACGTEKGSFVAACAEVEVQDGEIRVLSVCQAYECGAIHNPDNVRAQVVGSIIMGLGGALTEEIRFRDGKVLTDNFSSYRVPRMDDVPELDIVLLDRQDLPSVGAGETPIIAVAPAVAGAVYRAVGVRCRSLPLKLA